MQKPTANLSHFFMLSAILGLATGCQSLLSLREIIEGVVEPLAVQASYAGVVPPEDPATEAALAETEYATGLSVRAWPHDIRVGGEPATIAFSVKSVTDSLETPLRAHEDSGFVADGTDGLSYVPGEGVRLLAVYESAPRWIRVELPEAPVVQLPELHPLETALEIDLVGQDYSRAFVMVIDNDTAETVWSNLPGSEGEDRGVARGDEALLVEIPEEAFSYAGNFSIGVAGAWEAGPKDYADLNTALSGFTAARFVFSRICTTPTLEACELPPEGEVPGDTGQP
jgi:hypothetical protein